MTFSEVEQMELFVSLCFYFKCPFIYEIHCSQPQYAPNALYKGGTSRGTSSCIPCVPSGNAPQEHCRPLTLENNLLPGQLPVKMLLSLSEYVSRRMCLQLIPQKPLVSIVKLSF